MVPSIARQSVILKCNMQKSVMLGNYEFYYAAGLLNKLFALSLDANMQPEEILNAVLEKKESLPANDEQERYLIKLLTEYEPSEDHDAQMEELFAWGEQEPDMWQVTTSFHPKI